MSFVDSLELQPADPIFGLTEDFKADASDKKVNLGVGVYQSEDGSVHELEIVRKAATKVAESEENKSYLPIGGSPSYCKHTAELIFGIDSPIIKEKRIASIHTPGGTGALRVAGELLYKNSSTTKDIYISKPSWPNHVKIFGEELGSGFNLLDYPYYDFESSKITFDAMIEAISKAKKGSVVLLHLCCHNPTGADLSLSQWKTLAKLFKENELIPVVDSAYHGFSKDLQSDRAPFEILDKQGMPFVIAQSFSKVFSLYGERTGALHVVCNSTEDAKIVRSTLLSIARPIYSNPPCHGGKIVDTILSTTEMRDAWLAELAGMRDRINSNRARFCDLLAEKGLGEKFEHIRAQRGMFSITGLNPEQVEKLKTDFHVYMPKSGRVCIAALNSKNIEYVVNSIASVLAG